MPNRKKAAISMFLVFIYLFLTSQLHYMNIANTSLSHLRHLLRGFLDMLPLIVWYWFVKTRVIQPSVRKYLIIGSLSMQFSMFVIYLQTIIVTDNINLMALSVIGIFVPYFIFPVFSLLATFCLGMPEQYKLHRKYMILPAVAILLGVLAFTNFYHELFFKFDILPDDINRSSVTPGILCYISVVFCAIVIVWRMIAIKKFSKKNNSTKTFILILCSYILILLYHIPYVMIGFAAKWEFIGSTQFTFYIEILSWIICMSTGLIPVNTNYDNLYTSSSMDFEIYSKDGILVYPHDHTGLPSSTFSLLKNVHNLQYDDNTILHIASIRKKGYVVWKKDISYVNQLINKQEEIKKSLKDEEELLQNELYIANAREKINQKKKVYNQIDSLMRDDIDVLNQKVMQLSIDQYDPDLYEAIISNGIYVKRKSNLLILKEENEYVPLNELKLTIDEMLTGIYKKKKYASYPTDLNITVKTGLVISCLELLHSVISSDSYDEIIIRVEDENNEIYFRILYSEANIKIKKEIKLSTCNTEA